MALEVLRSKERKEVFEKVKENYGIEGLNHMLFRLGREKVYAYSGSLSRDEIIQLAQIANVEIVGLYFAKEQNGMKLSFDATQAFKDKITENILEIGDAQLKDWMLGIDLEVKCPKGFVVVKHGGDFVGCGKSNGDKVFNYVPKERRVRLS